MRTFVATCALVALIAGAVQTADAQCTPPTSRAWIIVTDNGNGRDTVWFGYDGIATYGLDASLCEVELPPPPPGGVFDVRFVNKPGAEGRDTPLGMGQGFIEDYRPPRSAQVADTHRVKYQAGEGGLPFTFTWDIAQVTAHYDSAVIQDEFGGILLKVRMGSVNTLQVTNPALSSLLLIGYKKATDVRPVDDVIPSEFGLQQNFPNPFNPSTTVRFAVARLAQTDVAVYDVLGKRVATVVADRLAPGTYEVTWNGTNDQGGAVASGVYLLRMDALDEQGGSFSALRKIVLMK